jgi:hypothetical protein
LKGFVFRTVVDGAERETLVAWSEMKPTAVRFHPVEEAYDYLGRTMPRARKVELTRAPVFLLLPRGGSKELTVVPPPAKAKWIDGKASSVVLQLIGKGDLNQSAFQLDDSKQLKLVAYNFGDKPARGKLSVEGATGAKSESEVAPGEREEQTIKANGTGKMTAKLNLGDAEHAIVTANVLKAQRKN